MDLGGCLGVKATIQIHFKNIAIRLTKYTLIQLLILCNKKHNYFFKRVNTLLRLSIEFLHSKQKRFNQYHEILKKS